MNASDPDPFASGEPVPSPCIGVCRMHHRIGLCEGCRRTLGEIAQWNNASEAFKLKVWASIGERKPQ